MIGKSLPGFCFVDPRNRNTINLRFSSAIVVGETRRIRAVWDSEMAQDLMAFHNIDAEAELTAILGNEIANEIDRQIIRDINDNGRFYREHTLNEALNRWNRLIPGMVENEATINYVNNNYFDDITIPIIRNPAMRTIASDLVPIQPLDPPNGLFHFIDYNQFFRDDYQVLPNEEGWFTKGTFESLLIKMDMRPFHFIIRNRRRNRRNDIRNLVGL